MENINIGDWVRIVETTFHDEAKGFRVGSSYKVIGKDSREGVLIVKTIIGYLSILASKVEKIGVSNEEIEAGDWIEVLEILEEDSNVDIDKGYVTQVISVLSDDGVEIRTKNGDTWWLHPFQIKKVSAPKSASTENPNENSETLKPIAEKVSDNSPNNNSDNIIRLGDWVEIVQTEDIDIIRGLKLGSKLKVLDFDFDNSSTLYKLQRSDDVHSIHFLWEEQIRKTESPPETKEQSHLKHSVDMYPWSVVKLYVLKGINKYASTLIKQMEEEK